MARGSQKPPREDSSPSRVTRSAAPPSRTHRPAQVVANRVWEGTRASRRGRARAGDSCPPRCRGAFLAVAGGMVSARGESPARFARLLSFPCTPITDHRSPRYRHFDEDRDPSVPRCRARWSSGGSSRSPKGGRRCCEACQARRAFAAASAVPSWSRKVDASPPRRLFRVTVNSARKQGLCLHRRIPPRGPTEAEERAPPARGPVRRRRDDRSTARRARLQRAGNPSL